MKKSLMKNYIYNSIYQIFAIIVPIITTPYLARVLGPKGIGISAYVISIATYFILFGTLGISLYGQKEVAYVQDDKYKKSKKFFELFLLKTFFTIITIFAYIIFLRNSEYRIYYNILIIEIIASIFDISWFFQGIENFKIIVFKNVIIKLVSLLLIFLFVKEQNDVSIYILIYALSTFIGNLSLWTSLKKEIVLVRFQELKIISNIKFIFLLFIPQVANRLYALIDKTMLGIMVSDIAETGFYEQSEKIVKIWITLITALGTVIMPRIANYYAKKNNKKINELVEKTLRYVFFCAFPMVFGLIAISNNIIPLYLGDGYTKSISLIQILSPIIIIIGLNNIIGNQYLIPTNQQKKYTYAVVSGCICNFVVNFILINKIGAYGASISTIISEIVVLGIEIYFTKNQFDYGKIFKSSKNYIISSVIMFMVAFALRNVTESMIINCLIQLISGFFLYILILILLNDSFFIEIVNKIKSAMLKNILNRKKAIK